jgi:hypothetical protein
MAISLRPSFVKMAKPPPNGEAVLQHLPNSVNAAIIFSLGSRWGLAVNFQEVVRGQAEAADGWFVFETGMWPVPVVAV